MTNLSLNTTSHIQVGRVPNTYINTLQYQEMSFVTFSTQTITYFTYLVHCKNFTIICSTNSSIIASDFMI